MVAPEASDLTVSAFAKALQDSNVRRGFVVLRDGKLIMSHPVLRPILALLEEDTIDFDDHEAIFVQAYEDCLFSATLWRTRRGQGCGGIRLRKYPSLEGFVRDGLRLSIGMGMKSALANLWWGGGKGVIAVGERSLCAGDPVERRLMLQEYGRFLTSLRGCYVAAEDAGMHVADMDDVFSTTRYTTCIHPDKGGSGNPSIPTAMGIVCGMEGALDALEPGSTLRGKSVAIQGLGNVGGALLGFLLQKGCKRVVGTDVNLGRVQELRGTYSGEIEAGRVEIFEDLKDILFLDVDIVSPCAFGGVLNAESVPRIKARIVCGAANNQLLDPSTDYGLQEREIVYCPDFVVNRMGIVNCANEQYGRIGNPGGPADPIVRLHLEREDPNSIFNVIRSIVKTAKASNSTTAKVAELMALGKSQECHPVFGHRTRAIVESLVRDGWASGKETSSRQANADNFEGAC